MFLFVCSFFIRPDLANEPYRHKHEMTALSSVPLFCRAEESGLQTDKVSCVPSVTRLKKQKENSQGYVFHCVLGSHLHSRIPKTKCEPMKRVK